MDVSRTERTRLWTHRLHRWRWRLTWTYCVTMIMGRLFPKRIKTTGNKWKTPIRTRELPKRNVEWSDFWYELLGGSDNNTGHHLLYWCSPSNTVKENFTREKFEQFRAITSNRTNKIHTTVVTISYLYWNRTNLFGINHPNLEITHFFPRKICSFTVTFWHACSNVQWE